MEDAPLRDRLAKSLAYDRVGYGTTAFNSITIGVKDGVVTLGGTVYGPPDKDSALSLVANTPGVKDIMDNLEVAPVSPMDDRLRLQLAPESRHAAVAEVCAGTRRSRSGLRWSTACHVVRSGLQQDGP